MGIWDVAVRAGGRNAALTAGPASVIPFAPYGPRYIDDTVLRRLRLPSEEPDLGGDGLPENWAFEEPEDTAFYHLTDVQFSTRAMVKAAVHAEVFERVRYEAYGRAHHFFGADVNEDGEVNTTDEGEINVASTTLIDDPAYDVRMDLNRDGSIDKYDESLANLYLWRSLAVPGHIGDTNTDPTQNAGVGPDNVFGYCGYVFAPENLLYHVRFRWYSPEHGRWLERDPIGYVDGMNLYAYADESPFVWTDPSGLRDCFRT